MIRVQRSTGKPCNLQVIYVVGVLKKRLAIPRHSPQMLRTLIPACWEDDPDLRPTFQTVFPLLQVQNTHRSDKCSSKSSVILNAQLAMMRQGVWPSKRSRGPEGRTVHRQRLDKRSCAGRARQGASHCSFLSPFRIAARVCIAPF